MLMNVKWIKAAARGTVATPLAATTASVLKAGDWGQMARHVTVRSGWHLDAASVQIHILIIAGSLGSWGFLCWFMNGKNHLPP